MMPSTQQMTGWIRSILAGLILLVMTVYPILAFQVYTQTWYEIGCEIHGKCDRLNNSVRHVSIEELTQFWRHQGELGQQWSQKERKHLAEVRPIYDGIFYVFILSVVLGLIVLPKWWRPHLPLWVAIGAMSPLLLVPFFKFFWVEVFHPLFFDNMDWNNTRADLSWYLMPRSLFMYSMIALVTWASILNLVIWVVARYSSLSKNKHGSRLD